MTGPEPYDSEDPLMQRLLRVLREHRDDAAEGGTPNPVMQRLFRIIREHPGDPDADEGGVAMTVPTPRRPSPHDSAIALPLPVEHESE